MRRVTRGRGRSGGAPARGTSNVVVSCPRRSVSGRVAAHGIRATSGVASPFARGRGDGKTSATGDADDALARIHPLGARRPPAADPGRGAARAAAIASGPSRARSAERPRATRRDALRERGRGEGHERAEALIPGEAYGNTGMRATRRSSADDRMPRRRPQLGGRWKSEDGLRGEGDAPGFRLFALFNLNRQNTNTNGSIHFASVSRARRTTSRARSGRRALSADAKHARLAEHSTSSSLEVERTMTALTASMANMAVAAKAQRVGGVRRIAAKASSRAWAA